jgi:hypothetical protein
MLRFFIGLRLALEHNLLIGLVALVTLIVSGCGFMSGLEDARELAEKLLNDRFVTGGIGSEAYYSDLFWKYTRQENWDYVKNLVETRLGSLQSYTLRTWSIQKNVKMGDLSGTFVVLIYDTEYEFGLPWMKIVDPVNF